MKKMICVHLTVIAIESIIGSPAHDHEDEAEHAEGEEDAAGVDGHRDDRDASDCAGDCNEICRTTSSDFWTVGIDRLKYVQLT